ncbi:MAG: CDP-glycerol glycerophosphotransferase family protein [Oscillospiraceae bacterium]|nr:CDP-glycerol glycerophosphotransferase family protein [Oscillospiraceae bacterium]
MRSVKKSTKRVFSHILRFFLQRLIFPVLYFIGRVQKINPKLAVFATDFFESPTDNMLPLIERARAGGFDTRFHGKLPRHRCFIVRKWRQYKRWLSFFFLIARARVIYLDEVFFPANTIRLRKGTSLVQLWHGCGAFKKWGYSTAALDWGASTRELRWLPMHQSYTHVCVSAPAVIPYYADAFHCREEIIHPWGAPRTDFFFRPGIAAQCRREVLARFPEIGGRSIVLYAPTFRGNSTISARHHDDCLDYALLTERLGADCALLLKPHPRVREPIPAPAPAATPFVFDARDLPIETLLCAADLVISDYSSLIFEYALLGRPMLFYAYDLEEYEGQRSFYEPYLSFVPGELVWSSEELAAGVRRNLFEGGFDKARVEAFRERYMSACDGNSTERIFRYTTL